jgi:hypothetical protein
VFTKTRRYFREYIYDDHVQVKRLNSLVLAPVLALAPAELGLDNEGTTINGVDHSVSGVEGEVAPGARVPNSRATARKLIILREDIEVSDFLDLATVGVLGNRADVEDTETGLVVGLVGETLVDELVVVDGAGSGLVVTSVLGLLKVGDVPDVGDRETVLGGRVGGSAGRVDLTLVELIVHDKVSLPHRVEDPALVGVGCTDVRSARDDLAGVGTVLVGHIVNGESVLVVAITDIAAKVFLIRSAVHNALSVCGFELAQRSKIHVTWQPLGPLTMCVTILRSATSLVGLSGIINVDEDGTTCTSRVATSAATTANSNGVVELLVGNDVVRAARNAVGDVHPANVLLDVEGLGVLGAELEQLLHVEELDAVANTLGSDDQSVSDLLDLAPNDTVVAGGQTSEVFELTLLSHFCEGGTIGLADGNELPASGLVSPAPAAGAFTNSITELCVSLEVVEILECVVSLSFSK